MRISLDKITKISIILGMVFISSATLFYFVYLPIKIKFDTQTRVSCERCIESTLEENFKEHGKNCDPIAMESDFDVQRYMKCDDKNRDEFIKNPCVQKCIKGRDSKAESRSYAV